MSYFPLMVIIIYLFLINIFSSTPCSNYSNPSYGFMNADNNLIILNSIQDKKELRIYQKDTNLNSYQLNTTLNLKQFPVNEPISIDINNLYHFYDESNGEVIFFNDEYYSIHKYSKQYYFFYDYYFSFIDNNIFIIPHFSIVNNYIEIFQFNYTKEPKFISLNNCTIKTNSIDSNPIKYLKCISTNNNIICGYILSISFSSEIDNFLIFFIDSNYNKTEDIKIYEYKISLISMVKKRWLELVPIGNEKLLFCTLNDNNDILCGLAQIEQNYNITVLKKPEIIFFSLSKDDLFQNFCSVLILNNNEVIMGCKIGNNIRIKRITINNNKIIKNHIYTNTIDCKKINNFQMLKDNDNYLILLVNYNSTLGKINNEFHYFGYSTCNDINQTIYNGEKTKLSFNDMSPIINFEQNLNDIVFIFDNMELVSLITTRENTIVSNKTYNKNEIYFKLNSTNFDYIKNNSVYSVIYSNNINEALAQRCHLTLSFNNCSSKCDLCTKDGKCYDKYWNKIVDDSDISDIPYNSDNKIPTKSSKIIYIIIGIIIFIIFIIIVIACIYLCNKNRNNNFIQNNDFIQPQNPLIYDNNNYNKKKNQNYYNNNNNQNYYNNQHQKPVDDFTKGNELIDQNLSNQDMGAPTPYYSS